jgi:hypothetical protein
MHFGVNRLDRQKRRELRCPAQGLQIQPKLQATGSATRLDELARVSDAGRQPEFHLTVPHEGRELAHPKGTSTANYADCFEEGRLSAAIRTDDQVSFRMCLEGRGRKAAKVVDFEPLDRLPLRRAPP